MCLALQNSGVRFFTEATPHEKVWGIGLSVCDLRVVSPASWCGHGLLGDIIERDR